MPLWPTDPREPYFGRGLWGWFTDVWQRLRSDEDGNLFAVLAGQEYDLAVGCADADDLFVGAHGYDGADWQKQGLIWSYSSRYLVNQTDVSPAAASMTIDLPAIASGYIARVFGVGVYRNTVAAQYASLQQKVGATPYAIQEIDMPLAGWMYSNDRPMFLDTGDNVRVIYRSCANGETCITSAWGYLMAVA